MNDLNDLYYFAMVVEHGGYAAAERVLGISKSRLSRRVAHLEETLGTRLLQRSARRFAVTEVGRNVFRHAQAMIAEAQSAREAVDRLSAEPRGLVRVACPVQIAQQHLAGLLPQFLADHPQVRIQLEVSNRRVDLINEGFDIALRVRSQLNDDGDLVMRRFGTVQQLLVASPRYLARRGRPTSPANLASHVTLAMTGDEARPRWELHGPDGRIERSEIQPRLIAHDFPVLLSAAVAGLGIALLPETVCADQVGAGELEQVLPDWSLPQGIFHAVFPSRRGLLPAVRVFIDHLVEQIPRSLEAARLDCLRTPGPG